MLNKSEYAKRRHKLMKKIGDNSIVILPAAPMVKRNGDYEYPYRQQSDFYYLTGFLEPCAVMVLLPNAHDGEFILFNRKKNRAEEIWTGSRLGQTGAVAEFGADVAYPIEELQNKLPELLEGRDNIHYTLGLDLAFDKILLNAIKTLRGRIRNGLQSPFAFLDISHSIHEMRLIKDSLEVDLMRKAAEISASAHLKAMQFCRPSMNEFELEAEILYEFNKNGARFPAYTPIVGSGANTCILHYNDNNKTIAAGSLVLIDAGCEYQYYAADITRTFPANGKFSQEQALIYELVLASQKAGLDTIKPGAAWDAPQKAIVNVLTQGLLDAKILKGDLDSLIETEAYFPFYMHKSGHWLGLDVHDVGRYKENGAWRLFQPGMVLTVEPGIYISADIPNVDPKWHNIGIRIEDDVLVTPAGYDILSKDVPKELKEIEAVMQK
jgi:Xaa-Pro aminopeptidase